MSGKIAQGSGAGAPRSRRSGGVKSFAKRLKNRHERRRARLDPEVTPTYGRYSGYCS